MDRSTTAFLCPILLYSIVLQSQFGCELEEGIVTTQCSTQCPGYNPPARSGTALMNGTEVQLRVPDILQFRCANIETYCTPELQRQASTSQL
jgi:hypothetical protein